MILGVLGYSLLYFLFAVGLGAGIGERVGEGLGKSPRLFAGIGAGVGLLALVGVYLVQRQRQPAPPVHWPPVSAAPATPTTSPPPPTTPPTTTPPTTTPPPTTTLPTTTVATTTVESDALAFADTDDANVTSGAGAAGDPNAEAPFALSIDSSGPRRGGLRSAFAR